MVTCVLCSRVDRRATERQLRYVAATRARERSVVSGVAPGSEFLEALATKA